MSEGSCADGRGRTRPVIEGHCVYIQLEQLARSYRLNESY
jgi:hypothetical protein